MIWTLVVTVVALAAGAAIVLVGALGLVGRLPRNHAVGIRIPSVLASDDAWERGHRAAGIPLVVGGCSMIVAAVCVPLLPDGDAVANAILTGVLVMGTAVAIGAVAAHRAAVRR